ncbi:thiocillin family RiPP [Amycolatopsis sp. NPDC059657]|uniref:thiocillin family RiPP n=1 Tax=Amycolatopsis sp. NPDC059657 TaxID=3346899 RepID=UPI00366C14C6
MTDTFELYVLESEMAIEALPEGNALSSVSSAGSVSTAACPFTSAGTASSIGCFG